MYHCNRQLLYHYRTMIETKGQTATDLRAQWSEFRSANPKVRIRNAARELGVSEAELVAVSENTTRIDADWGDLLEEIEPLGEVMALTRNDACVHEKKGVYANVQLMKAHKMGLLNNRDIDLRIFFREWKYGFAVETPFEGSPDGTRRSLQFFNAAGTAVHKIFLTRKSEVSAYDALVERHKAEVSEGFEVAPKRQAEEEKPDSEIDVDGFLKAWGELKDTHDFFPLLRRFGVTRRQAVRLAEGSFTDRVELSSLRQLLDRAAETEAPIMVFTGSPGCIQIHSGPINKVMEHGPWYNVLDPGFNLHVNEELLDTAWVVRKPAEAGTVTAVEFFDSEGEMVVQFFGERKPGIPELESWRAIVAELPREK